MAAPEVATNARATNRSTLYFRCMFSSCCGFALLRGSSWGTCFVDRASAETAMVMTQWCADPSGPVPESAACLHDRFLMVKPGPRASLSREAPRMHSRAVSDVDRCASVAPLPESRSAAVTRAAKTTTPAAARGLERRQEAPQAEPAPGPIAPGASIRAGGKRYHRRD